MNARQLSEIEDGREPTRAETVECTLFSLVVMGFMLSGLWYIVIGVLRSFG